MSRLSHTLSLSERLKRQRDGTASATPVGERAGPFGCTPSSPAGALLHTGDLRGPGGGAEASSWWRAQNDSVSKLDGLLSNLGVSSSLRTTADVSGPSLQREVRPLTAERSSSTHAVMSGFRSRRSSFLHPGRQNVDSASTPGSRWQRGDSTWMRSCDTAEKTSFRSRLDAIDGLLDSFLPDNLALSHRRVETNGVPETRQSNQRSSAHLSPGAMRPPSPGAVQAAADQAMHRLQEHEATAHEKTLQRRLEVLQAHNEQMANQTEDLVQTVNLYQTQNRQLKEEVSQRDGWIRETIQQLNPVDGDFASHELRAGLSRWLQSVVKEAQVRASVNPTVLDVRKAQAHADEMSIRERDVRSRLVEEANKSRIAQQFVSSAQVALSNSHHRMSLTEAEVSLLRQQLQEALLSNQQAIQELTKTRGHARSLEGKVLVLEGQLHNLRAELHEKKEELHSLHFEYNHRLVQLEELRHDKTNLETQVQRVCGGLKHVVDELRSPSAHKRATGQGRQERERHMGEVSARAERRGFKSGREEQGRQREDFLTARDGHRGTPADLWEFENGDYDVQDSEQEEEEQYDELYDDLGRARRHGQGTRSGREEYEKKSRSSPSRVSFDSPTSPRASPKSSQTHPPSKQRGVGNSSKRESAEHCGKNGSDDAQQWLEMEDFEVEDFDPQLSSDATLPEGDSAIAAAMLAPVGNQGPWRNPGVLWEDNGSAVDLQELHQNGKELSGFWLRRALKALGHGNSIALSVVDAQVQRQILLGVSSRGVPNCAIVSLPLHATVIKQGKTSQHMLVVLQGRIKIWRSERNASGRLDGGVGSTYDASPKKEEDLGKEMEHDHDTVLTECVGGVSEGGVLLEIEAVLGLSSPYTAMVATSSSPPRAGGGSGTAWKKRDTDKHVCEVLSVTGEALTALVDLYPSLHISERLVLSRKAFPYPGRALCISEKSDLSDDTSWSPQDLTDLALPPPFPDEEPRSRSLTGKVDGNESRGVKMGGGTLREKAWRDRDKEMEREMKRERERERELDELKNRAWLVAADLSDAIR